VVVGIDRQNHTNEMIGNAANGDGIEYENEIMSIQRDNSRVIRNESE
jgi:hypothetical protein